MGIFNSRSPGQPSRSGELHNLQLTQSVYGTTVPIIFGTRRVAGKLLFYGGFHATKAPNSAGKGIFGGKSTQYDYFADVQIALASGSASAGCQGLLNVWDQNGKLYNLTYGWTYTVPVGGGTYYPLSAGQPSIQADLGCSYAQSYSVPANDYGSGTSQVLTGSQQVVMQPVNGTPGAGQYSFNAANSSYTFAAADVGRVINGYSSSVFSLYYYVETQAAQVPLYGPYTISPDNQQYFSLNLGVVRVDTGATLAVGTDYTVSSGYGGGVYTFSSALAGVYVYLTYQYTSSDPSVTNTSKLNLTFFRGMLGQQPWSYMQSKYPSAAFGYTGTCYVGANPMALGESATLPSYNYEVIGLAPFGGGVIDAHPCDAFRLLLSDPLIGVGFPYANVDTWTSAYAYWAANNYFISQTLDTQTSASDAMQTILDTGNVAAVWSAGLLKLIPYGDVTAIGNGYTYVPNTTPAVTLTWNNLLPPSDMRAGSSTQDDPLQIAQRAPQDCWNYVQAQWCNRTNDYNNELINEQNDAFIQSYGLRMESPQTWDFLTTRAAATWALNLRLKRQCYIRNTYKFWLPYTFCALEPMDMVVLPTGEPVRITQITDSPDGRLAMEAEQWSYGSADVTLYPKQTPTSFQPNFTQGLPGNTIPVFIQNTLSQSIGVQNKLQIAATGQNANWGGCKVYVSIDGITYSPIGTITSNGVLGVLTANLPSGPDPDTSDTLSVDINYGLASNPSAELVSVTQQQADQLISLCAIIDQNGLTNELIAYQSASLTAAGRYNLHYLRRGAYGSNIYAHTQGAAFVFLGPSYQFLDYQYPPQAVTSTFYIKLASFNLAGNQVQSLSDCKAWPFQVGLQGSNLTETYVPSTWTQTLTTGSPTATNPTAAFDRNFSTNAVFDCQAGALVEGNYAGFPNTVILNAMTLYVVYQNARLGDPINASTILNISGIGGHGTTGFWANYAAVAQVAEPTNGSAMVTIPAGTNLSSIAVQVINGGVNSRSSTHFEIVEMWIQ